jgi:hypothetical protein
MEEHDVFISYAHRDNQPLLQTAAEKGWVSNFDEILSNFLTRELGRDARIWRDKSNSPGDYFGDKIKENLLKSKAFVLILSPSYVNSQWCHDEFDLYLKERKPIRIGDKSCVFPIIKKPVEKNAIPPKWDGILKDVLAAEFFKREGEDKTLTLDVEYGAELKQELLKKIDFLAQDIYLLLKKDAREQASETASEPSSLKPFLGTTIYMAEPTPDLWDDYQKVRRDFIKRGAIVLPASFDFSRPEKIEEYRSAMLADLQDCKLIVHFIGSRDTEYSEDDPQSLVRLQMDVAAEYQAGANCTRLIFVPQAIAPASESHARFVEQLSAMTSRNVDLLRTPLELRTQMENVLTGKPKPQAQAIVEGAKPIIYILHDAQDRESADALDNKLFENGCEVWRVSPSSGADLIEEHKYYLLNCDAALVYWNKAPVFRVRAMMSELQRILDNGRERPFRATGVYIDGGSPEKTNFRTHEMLVRNESDFAAYLAKLKNGEQN